jgi:ubiquinone/menaquinone biosynthesis C-methylase UbiE
MDSYKKLSVDYEALNPKEEIFKQEDFFKKLIKDSSVKTCLDCACGTGWHLSMLKKLGIKCYGSDLSTAMLSIARKNLKGTGIILKNEDFRYLSYSWKNKFDMIICMSTSFPHMLTDKDAITALRSMFAQLNNNGILVIVNGISDSLLGSKPKFIPARIHKNQAFYFFMEYLNNKRIIFNILNIKKTSDGFQYSFDIMEYNAIRKSTMDKYFSKTIFKNVKYYGDFDFSRYSVKKSPRLIVVAER